MRIPFLVASAALAAIPLGAWFSACSNGNPATPSAPPLADSGLPIDDGSSRADTGVSSGDASSVLDSSTVADSGGAAEDAGPCAPDAGTTIFAKFDFAATVNPMDGGPGQVLTVNVCDSVVWQNDDVGQEHGVLSPPDVGSFFNTGTNTGVAADGGAAFPPVRFTTAGTYKYDCAIHSTMMIGEITVR